MVDSELLTPAELAREWRCSVSWIYAAVARREIPHMRLGRMVRFRRDELAGFMAAHGVTRGGLLNF